MGGVDPVLRLRDLRTRLRRLPDVPWLEVELGDKPVLFVRVRGRSVRGTLPGVMVRRRRRVSTRMRPAGFDWTGRNVIWSRELQRWGWAYQGPCVSDRLYLL